MKVTHNLKPIYNKNSKILILGSIPSITSRNEMFYYANKNNRFWKIINVIFNVNLKSNSDKTIFLLNNNIALWDIIKSCDITSSSDSSIKNVKVNNIKKIINNSAINTIFLIGKKTESIYKKFFNDLKINYFYLPGCSSANASFSLNDLIIKYSIIKKYLK